MTPASGSPKNCHDTPETPTLTPVTRKQGKGTARQTIRADEGLWEEFGDATSKVDSDRSTVLRDFMRWFTRRHGAELPQRPEQSGSPGGAE